MYYHLFLLRLVALQVVEIDLPVALPPMGSASNLFIITALLALSSLSLALSSTSLLKSPLASSPPDIYVAPVNFNHTLLGPLGLPPASSAQWYLPQWSNPLPLNGSSSSVIPGPAKWRCTEQPSPTSVVSWRVDNGATRVCAWADNITRYAISRCLVGCV